VKGKAGSTTSHNPATFCPPEYIFRGCPSDPGTGGGRGMAIGEALLLCYMDPFAWLPGHRPKTERVPIRFPPPPTLPGRHSAALKPIWDPPPRDCLLHAPKMGDMRDKGWVGLNNGFNFGPNGLTLLPAPKNKINRVSKLMDSWPACLRLKTTSARVLKDLWPPRRDCFGDVPQRLGCNCDGIRGFST
jgi:hypothetical protein